MNQSADITTVQSVSNQSEEKPLLKINKFNRQFARKQWRKQLGDMFQFRGRLPSCPSFKEFCGKLSDPI